MGGKVMHKIIVGVTVATWLSCMSGMAGSQAKNGDKDSPHPAFKVLNGSRANPSITLTELLESYEKAVGGKEAIEKIRTVVAYEERRAQTKPGAPRFGSSVDYFNFSDKAKNVRFGSSVEYFNFSNKAKNVLTIPTGSRDAFGYDGETVWHDGPNEGVQRMPSETNVLAEQQSNLLSLLHLRVAFPQMMLAGSSKVEGRDVYVVDAPFGSLGLYRHLFFDAETRLLIGSIVIQLVAGQTLISEQFYSDFRVVHGVKFPFAVRAIEYTSQSSVEIRMTRIECNIPLPDDLFSENPTTAGPPLH
jgi:hypothetical protein